MTAPSTGPAARAPLAATLAELPAAADRDGTEAEFDLADEAAPPRPGARTVREFLDHLLASRLVGLRDLERFLHDHGGFDDDDLPRVTTALVDQGLLTGYQVSRLRAGQPFGLVLGNYRITDRLGAGGMGVVYKAEHLHLKRTVAIKVLVTEDNRSSIFLQRFFSEMQAMAVLHHPNIVTAFDAGEVPVPGSRHGVLRYLAMEYAPGQTLEQHVQAHGPVPAARACRLICQAAQGLQHAHEHGLVHRDIKPSNLMLTPRDQVKILDLGLARMSRRRHTEAHSLLGTLDYMAPEQARDARAADIRADIYGLGGTLYWLLTGQRPFPGDRPLLEELLARQRETPVPLRQVRPDLPAPLESIVGRMLAHNPDDRFPTPLAVVSALTAFQESSTVTHLATDRPAAVPAEGRERTRRVLIVSGRTALRESCRAALEGHGLECSEAGEADDVYEQLGRIACDVVLIDGDLVQHGGLRLCHRLRTEPPAPHLKLMLLTTSNSAEQIAAGQKVGADDCVPRTVVAQELAARVRTLLRVKEAEERADCLANRLLLTDEQLDESRHVRHADLYQAQDVLIFAMAKMAELRRLETAAHLRRMQGYVRVLAEEAQRLPAFAGRIDAAFVRMLERCVPLHDIGKVALPDHILLKPGRLDGEERAIMESHAGLGADILAAVARQQGAPLAFLQVASDIARHHHERYDGTGYPDGLTGEAIPLAARITTVADVYDALRCKLVYKPGLAHAATRRLLLENSVGQFDPALLVAFRRCEAGFEQVFAQGED